MKKSNTKLTSLVLATALSTFALVGCGGNEASTPNNSNDEVAETTSKNKGSGNLINTEEKFSEMYSNPNKYKGDNVEFYAKIFLEPEIDGENTYFQCYAFGNENLNTVVSAKGKLDLKDGDTVLIKGKSEGKFDSENAFGAKLSLAGVVADTVEKTDYASAFAPSVKTVEVNKEIDQHGYVMTVNRVEFAEKETRAYVSIKNNTNSNISFYGFNTKAVQGSNQLKEDDTYGKGYEEIESELLPGVADEGIITFSKGDPSQPLTLHLDGSSDNYDLDFQPFVFEVQ